jgi:hypothetical protein
MSETALQSETINKLERRIKMKTKKSEKRLVLNKITIARLNGLEMRAAVGGQDNHCLTLDETCLFTGEPDTKGMTTSC